MSGIRYYGRLNATCEYICRGNVVWCIEHYFPDVAFSTREYNTGKVILQIPSSL